MYLNDYMIGYNTKSTNELDLYNKIEGLGAHTEPTCKNDCLNFFGKTTEK